MANSVKSAIESGDVRVLRALLSEDPSGANRLIEWGQNREIHTHPLHYVSDMLFGRTLERGKESPLIDALLEAGADPNHRAASNNETPLMGAASLDAEDVGLRLLEAGAVPDAPEDPAPLHWAAHEGLDRLVSRLIEKGAAVNRVETQFSSTPLGWAIHGRFNSRPRIPPANHLRVIEYLVSAGAQVRSEWLTDDQVRSDSSMLAALKGTK
jgi:uncharacterized protein